MPVRLSAIVSQTVARMYSPRASALGSVRAKRDARLHQPGDLLRHRERREQGVQHAAVAPPAVGQEAERLDAERDDVAVLLAPQVHHAEQAQEGAPRLALRAQTEAPLHGRDRRAHVVGLERLLRGPHVVGDRALTFPALLEVLGDHERVLPAGLEVEGGREVPLGAIVRDHQPVGRVAHQPVAEADLPLTGEAALEALLEDLRRDQDGEPRAPRRGGERPATPGSLGALRQRRRRCPEEGLDPAHPRGLAEHARGAQRPARRRIQAPDARLQDRQHRLRDLAPAPLRLRADQLLQEERVARALLGDPHHRLLRRAGAEHLVAEPLARLPAQRAQEQRLREAGPRRREQLRHLRPREREHHQRALPQLAQRDLAELHRERVAPVQILQDEEQGVRRGLRAEEVDDGEGDLIAHHQRILARRAELDLVLLGERDLAELPHERDHAPAIRGGEVLGHAAREPGSTDGEILAVEDPGEALAAPARAARTPIPPSSDRRGRGGSGRPRASPRRAARARDAGATCPSPAAPSPAPRAASRRRCSPRA